MQPRALPPMGDLSEDLPSGSPLSLGVAGFPPLPASSDESVDFLGGDQRGRLPGKELSVKAEDRGSLVLCLTWEWACGGCRAVVGAWPPELAAGVTSQPRQVGAV